MRLHTSLSAMHVIHAVQAEHQTGRVPYSVTIRDISRHGSSIRPNAVELILTCSEKVPGDGRRAGNSGAYGAMDASEGYAATYDEWGWILAALYAQDPTMVVGSPGTPIYANRHDFDHRTGLSYNPAAWMVQVLEWPTFADERDPYPYVAGKNTVGRRGFGRLDERTGEQYERRGWPIRHAPRSVAEMQAFAHLTDAEVAAFRAEAVHA